MESRPVERILFYVLLARVEILAKALPTFRKYPRLTAAGSPHARTRTRSIRKRRQAGRVTSPLWRRVA